MQKEEEDEEKGEGEEALVDLIWSILRVSCARRQTPRTCCSTDFYLCLAALPFTCHMGAVSLPVRLCASRTPQAPRVSEGFKPLNCSLE